MNYIIKNDYIQATINSYGAQLNSLKKIDESLDYIWCADEKYWNRSSPILFPIVGKLKDNEYIYNNKTYKMNQHGFARDKEFEIAKLSDLEIKFRLSYDESTLKIYPFKFELYLSYKLEDNRLIISYEVINKDDDLMYFSIGAHPAFNWPLEDERKDECYLELDKKIASRFFLEDGLLSNFSEMNSEKIYLSDELFSKDALVFKNEFKEVVYKNTQNDRFVKINFKDFPYLGIWSKPTGAPFLCIEPWHGVADNINHNKDIKLKEGVITLKAQEVFRSTYSIEI
ncbi:LACX protein [Malaciobacter pacificus]|uniref:Aldose 1-epimerase n=1 Tax=Malaciobacter pacificus TaxID=1080223 RepID=A0A5C2H727_9BACT|nr:aldose 1-epimerase family protein [Malaciobacter pacificus]QEP34119.1 aldose 1-epimerase [Malaciobacter pacificus]GGD47054.1 LACX protein [Malaciobacter pacificus]